MFRLRIDAASTRRYFYCLLVIDTLKIFLWLVLFKSQDVSSRCFNLSQIWPVLSTLRSSFWPLLKSHFDSLSRVLAVPKLVAFRLLHSQALRLHFIGDVSATPLPCTLFNSLCNLWHIKSLHQFLYMNHKGIVYDKVSQASLLPRFCILGIIR